MGRDRGIGDASKVTARDIIIEILHNMREGAEEMYSRVLVPSFYQVFLHEGDFQRCLLYTSDPRAVGGGARICPNSFGEYGLDVYKRQ